MRFLETASYLLRTLELANVTYYLHILQNISLCITNRDNLSDVNFMWIWYVKRNFCSEFRQISEKTTWQNNRAYCQIFNYCKWDLYYTFNYCKIIGPWNLFHGKKNLKTRNNVQGRNLDKRIHSRITFFVESLIMILFRKSQK
jgi:hypothetical protein